VIDRCCENSAVGRDCGSFVCKEFRFQIDAERQRWAIRPYQSERCSQLNCFSGFVGEVL
jgi:hypothetical protein